MQVGLRAVVLVKVWGPMNEQLVVEHLPLLLETGPRGVQNHSHVACVCVQLPGRLQEGGHVYHGHFSLHHPDGDHSGITWELRMAR